MMFKVRGDYRCGYYHVLVYAGSDEDHLAFCGELRMRPEECKQFAEALEIGFADLEVPAEIVLVRPAAQRLREMEEAEA